MSKRAKAGCAICKPCIGSANTCTELPSAKGLVGAGLLTRDEYEIFARAEDFLWAVRCHLHYITDRAVDQLTFDLQVEVAARMGYRDTGGRRAVEHFMQDYFRQATKVGELTRVFLTQLEARHVKSAPALMGFFRRRKRLKPGFKLEQGRIDLVDPTGVSGRQAEPAAHL